MTGQIYLKRYFLMMMLCDRGRKKSKCGNMNNFIKSRAYERYYPQGFGIAAAASVFFFEICFPLQNGLLLGASVTFGAILFGFTGTAFAVFNISTDFMERVRRANQEIIFDLRKYIGDALLAPMLLCVISVIGMFGADYGQTEFARWLMALWLGASVFCLAALRRLSRIMLVMFSRPDHHQQKRRQHDNA